MTAILPANQSPNGLAATDNGFTLPTAIAEHKGWIFRTIDRHYRLSNQRRHPRKGP